MKEIKKELSFYDKCNHSVKHYQDTWGNNYSAYMRENGGKVELFYFNEFELGFHEGIFKSFKGVERYIEKEENKLKAT